MKIITRTGKFVETVIIKTECHTALLDIILRYESKGYKLQSTNKSWFSKKISANLTREVSK